VGGLVEKEDYMKMDSSDLLSPTENVGMKRKLRRGLLSLLPACIIAGLLYAALFIKPAVTSKSLPLPVVELRDRFYGVAMLRPEDVWAVGNDGKIVRSTDGGKIWAAQKSGTTKHLQSIAAWDDKDAVVVGNSGTILFTSDGGGQWRKAGLPASVTTQKLVHVRAEPDKRIWAVGEMGTVIVSANSGATWTSASTRTEDMSWNDIGFVGAHGCLVGEFGRIRCSHDGGATWLDVASPVKSSLNSIAFRNEKEAVAVGLEGVILQTVDGGAEWRALPKATDLHLYDVVWDGARWIAVGDRGVALSAGPDASHWTDISKDVGGASWRTQLVDAGGWYALAGQGIKLVRLDSHIK
jgi:photosystem II stability/assembly factor-like uncharacterized protein